jgi:RNA polymerase sigma factor (sigma-70 family)
LADNLRESANHSAPLIKGFLLDHKPLLIYLLSYPLETVRVESPNMDDEFLSFIGRCNTGDGPSWDVFFSKYGSIAIQFLTRRYPVLSSDENDDITQNIFIKLANGGLRNFNGTTGYEFLAYFKKIAANEAFTWLRGKKRQGREISIDQEPDEGNVNAPSAPILADNTFRPDRAAEVKDLLVRVLEGLSVEEKRILVYKAEGYKDHEIAELLGIPMGTVASRYNRIKAGARNIMVAVFLLIIFGRK